MSNLWKALRDVSRDADPAVGFEPPAQEARADGLGLASTLSDLAGSPPVVADVSGQEAHRPPAGPTPPQARSHVSAAPVRPATSASRLSRTPLGPAAQPEAPVAGPVPRRTNGSVPSPTAGAPGNGGFVPPRAAGLRNRLAEALNTVEPHGPAGMARPRTPTSTDRPLGTSGPGSREAVPSVAPPSARSTAGTSGPAHTSSANTNSALTNLPKALPAFAPGTPDTVQTAAAVGAPQWHPGDDDVMPKDGRRAVKPRLRDRFTL